ncbi:hypothetical protein OG194_17900 [Streptomyces sp. NBC_01288]|uniref:hypothetical protein n=1 Tax=Streptomyces sp. NBC_01288 TaxID=2903814 RepID=UPI002E14D518|nr:hypothetical protein OG194_17900 [Streptomyces sp. NBC_01288]
MSDKPSEEPSSTPEIPDDVWEQFARDTERDIRASAPKEPSARAREVTERLKQDESKKKGKAKRQEPEGWRTGPAWQEMNGRARRRRRAWAVIGVPLAIAVAVVAMRPSLIPGDPFGKSDGGKDGPDAAAASPLAPETAAPTAAPSAVDPETPTLDRPFAGSPALNWADGAAGIVLPQAKAVGVFSKGQVQLALKQAEKLLVDANLRPKTIAGARPTAALAVLDPKQPGLIAELNTSLSTPTKAHDPLMMFSRFAPKDVRLVGDVVKTRGRITFKKGEHSGVLIHADYTFVYPVVRTDGSTEVTRTIVRRVLDLQLLDPARYQVTSGRLSVLTYNADFGNSACDVYDGYFHPGFSSPSSAEPTGAAPSGPTTDPYDRSKGIGEGEGENETCGTVSRT